MSGGRHALADFQARAVDGVSGVLRKVAEDHDARPDARAEIALRRGVTLLQSPTGSGKTLMLGRVLEGLRGALSRPVVWFWFAPYAGLVAQTRDALVAQCGSLCVRDVTVDREPVGTRDGDVFVQTWGSVAANNKDARRVRRTKEAALSLDDLIAELRDRGFFVGVVIDEAHLNFGASAKVAAGFYLETLRPDFTILATATPNDDKLVEFERKAGIEVASRVVVARSDVVAAGLNKEGLMLGVLRMREEDRDLIDHEQATLTAGWTQHCRVKERLVERGLGVVPLMLVQVENEAQGGADPVARVRQKLLEIGVPDSAIAAHTSGQPDPDFHTLAYDPDTEVLIFKVAVATGFDAPRAWTLVSVRPNRGREFGLQIVGRIMRVHPAVRPIHGEDPVLDRGYVFLTDPESQTGLDAAVEEVKAVRESIELITDRLDVQEFGTASRPLGFSDVARMAGPTPPRPASPEDRQLRLGALVEAGLVPPDMAERPAEDQDKAILAGETWQQMVQTPLFGALPETAAPGRPALPGPDVVAYPLREDLGVPHALWRELPPEPTRMNELVDDIARGFCQVSGVLSLIQKTRTKAVLTLRDLFLEDFGEDVALHLRLSNARVAAKAQMAFDFNDSIDPRLLKRAMVGELRRIIDEQGIEAEEAAVRRALDLAVMREPDKLKDAMKAAQSRRSRLSRDEEVPREHYGARGLTPSRKGAYGVFPSGMNEEEARFAEFLDADTSGTVLWWLRNVENTRWATRLLLPSGKTFFPDFVVGIAGRRTPDTIALVEIKDDGETGRLQADRNIEKIQVRHKEYGSTFWAVRLSGNWERVSFNSALNRIQPESLFRFEDLVL